MQLKTPGKKWVQLALEVVVNSMDGLEYLSLPGLTSPPEPLNFLCCQIINRKALRVAHTFVY